MRISLVVGFLAAVLGLAPADDVVVLPTPPIPVVPVPPVGSRVKLDGAHIYPFSTTAPCVVRAYPAALLSIKAEPVLAGETLRVRDTFFDGTSTKTFKGPCTVYFVQAAGKGAAELVITPIGFKLEADIKTVGIDVNGGQAPQPPPVPPDPPAPVTSFRVIWVFESGTTPTGAQNVTMNAKVVRDYLNANCTKEDGRAGWRQYDPQQVTTDEQPVMKALWASVKPSLTVLPCVVIEVNGKAVIEAFPASHTAAMALFDKYRGVK